MDRAKLPSSSLLDRLWAKVDIGSPDECWPFTGCIADGYGRIGLGTRAQGTAKANRVVAIACHGPAPGAGYQARHLCGNRACCNPAHIAWGTQSDNEKDKVAHGLSNRGERSGHALLTNEQVREIRRRCAAGESQRSVGSTFGIAQQSVSEIVTRRTWAWLDDEGGDAK